MVDRKDAPPPACSICGEPVMTREALGRALVAVERALAATPATGDEQLPAYLDAEIRPRLIAAAAELFGVHLDCRLLQAAGLTATTPPEILFDSAPSSSQVRR